MKRIPVKNYFILAFMVVITVMLTFVAADFYNNVLRKTTSIYKYANRLKAGEVDEYLDENSSVIIYVADKYDLTKEEIENALESKIIEHNLYNNFVYIDKREFNQKLVDLFNNKYQIKIEVDRIPTIMIYSDDNNSKIYYSVDKSVIENLDFGDIK